MEDLIFLMVFPFAIACVLLAVRSDRVRGAVSEAGAGIIMVASVYAAWNHLGSPEFYGVSGEWIDTAMFAAEAVLALAVIRLGIKYKKWAASALGVVQLCLSLSFEFTFKGDLGAGDGIHIDDLGVVMALIIGIVGSLISAKDRKSVV